MISDADLLQAIATIIAGILIFLTIAPFSRGAATQIKERKAILWTVYAIVALFILSTAFILFGESDEDSFFLAKIIFFTGLLGVITAIILMMLHYRGIKTEQRGQ